MAARAPKKDWGKLIKAFNFAVEITYPGKAKLCAGAFSECDGMEMSQEIKTIREGGNNGRQPRFAGPTTYGTLTLKRGMTTGFDLWDWFEQSQLHPALRARTQVVVKAPDFDTPWVTWLLLGCIPLKLKSPALNAKDGLVAIEELQVAYESMVLRKPEGG